MPQYPGPKSAALLDELARYVIAEPYPFVLDIAKGEGMYLETVDGQRMFDWTGYYGSKLLGHNHPAMLEANYVRKLVYAANNKVANPDFLTPECLDYYRFLRRVAPASMENDRLEVYAVNSGAEAVENMMKYLIARFNHRAAQSGRPVANKRFLYFEKAFHGRTGFALGVTQTIDPVATKDFHGLTALGNIKLTWPAFNSDASYQQNLRSAEQALTQVDNVLKLMPGEVMGILVEPIQGAGGHRVALPEFFRELSALAHRHEVPLAFDEVQTGLGATGRMWAIDHFNLPHPPMALASGKKFGNGVVYMYEPLTDIGVLDSTWGGSLADMVRVVREMQVVEEEGLIERAAETGEYLAAQLRDLAAAFPGVVSNVRGMGIYQGFSLDTPARKSALIQAARESQNLLLLGAGNRTVRLRPNLNITQIDVDELMVRLRAVLPDIAREPNPATTSSLT